MADDLLFVYSSPGTMEEAAISTPWRNRIVGTALGREKRVFRLHKSFN